MNNHICTFLEITSPSPSNGETLAIHSNKHGSLSPGASTNSGNTLCNVQNICVCGIKNYSLKLFTVPFRVFLEESQEMKEGSTHTAKELKRRERERLRGF